MMTNNGLKIPKEQLAALRPGDVQSYLLSRGWLADREASPPRGTLFGHPSIPDAERFFPLIATLAATFTGWPTLSWSWRPSRTVRYGKF